VRFASPVSRDSDGWSADCRVADGVHSERGLCDVFTFTRVTFTAAAILPLRITPNWSNVLRNARHIARQEQTNKHLTLAAKTKETKTIKRPLGEVTAII
jgi:hypothetical protein